MKWRNAWKGSILSFLMEDTFPNCNGVFLVANFSGLSSEFVYIIPINSLKVKITFKLQLLFFFFEVEGKYFSW